jgi:mercuric ion binding protein
MKNLKIFTSIILFGTLLVSCKNQSESDKKSTENTDNKVALVAKAETVSFTISGMSCAVMCANKIEKELAATKGVQKATVDFEKKLATVTFDSNVVSAKQLVEKVEGVAGGKTYKVSNLKTAADKA